MEDLLTKGAAMCFEPDGGEYTIGELKSGLGTSLHVEGGAGIFLCY
jgi:hypothetical protein